MRNVNRCGLCVVDTKRKKIVVLRRRCPYSPTPRKKTLVSSEPFVEQFCIPRGCQNSHEAAFICGVREFIEECGFFFKSFYKLPQTFDLEWEDPKDQVWRYTISFILADMDSIFVPLESKITDFVGYLAASPPEDQQVFFVQKDVLESVQDEENTQDLKINLRHSIVPVRSKSFRRIQNKEFVQATIMDLNKYYELIDVQQKCYIKNNYSSFIGTLNSVI